jgi:hypothetical protein
MNLPSAPVVVAASNDALTEQDFFQNVPPGQSKVIGSLNLTDYAGRSDLVWKLKDIFLYCTHEKCDGYRNYQPVRDETISREGTRYDFITVRCRNCNLRTKRFAISTKLLPNKRVEIYKYGELPNFGPPNPAKLMNLMGKDRDSYLKGRRCENQGLGIAAFAYYRRVVENQKTQIIGEILKVAQKLNADPALIADLEAAKQETRFTEAISRVKHALPQVLLINGHNPLTLLHSALSEGLHVTSDEDCLEMATSIRVVLTELVERMATAVKEEAELKSAVQRLLMVGVKK